MEDDNEKQRRTKRGNGGLCILLSLVVLLLAGMGAAYICTTVNLYARLQQLEGQQLSSRTGSLEEDATQLQQNLTDALERIEMLETKETSLKARVDQIELDTIANVSLLETGRCSFVSLGQSEVTYSLYAYTLQNLTHYYAEFGGNSTATPANVVSTNTACSSPVYTRRSGINVFGCGVDSITPASNRPSTMSPATIPEPAAAPEEDDDVERYKRGSVSVPLAPLWRKTDVMVFHTKGH